LRQIEPAQAKQTGDFLRKLQTPSGGFQPAPAKPGSAPSASLRATLAAVRALHYLGGEVPDRTACSTFVDKCFDPQTGAFSDTPAGKADVIVTALGVMAVVD